MTHQQQRLLRIREVCARVGLSRPEIYRREKNGKFPQRVQIGIRAVAWAETEISAWIDARIEDARAA